MPKKLTKEVFSRTDCPEGAKYAAVDSTGKAYWYYRKPTRYANFWAELIEGDGIPIPGKFDTSNWETSLSKRKVKPIELTQDVFNQIHCPSWAKYAAIDVDGTANWFEDLPMLSSDGQYWFPKPQTLAKHILEEFSCKGKTIIKRKGTGKNG